MILIAMLLILTYSALSFEEPPLLRIPLKHSITKYISAEVEIDYSSKLERTFSADPNYNLHGMLGQGYYIELAVGQPEQLVNHIHIYCM